VGLLFLACAGSIVASPLRWSHSFETTLKSETAETSQKPILVEVYADWCGYCKKMRQEIYTKPEFSKRASDFDWVSINGEIDTQFSNRYRVDGFPTVIFFDTNGVEIQRINGYVDASKFYQILHSAFLKKDRFKEIEQEQHKNPSGFSENLNLGSYWSKADQLPKALQYYWQAYRCTEPVDFMQRRRVLYNIAALTMHTEVYDMSASLFDAYVRTDPNAKKTSTDENQTTDVVMARYWRAVSNLRFADQQKTDLKPATESMIRKDLEYASKRLPFAADRNEAKRLLAGLATREAL